MRTSILLVLVSGCTIHNPAFELLTTGSSEHTTGGADPVTTAPTDGAAESSGTASTTGSIDPDTGVGTTATPTGGATTSTGPDDTGPDDSTGEDTDQPASCWAMGPANWPLAGFELEFLDVGATDPSLSPDGLRLYYIALAERRPFVSTRATRSDPFPNGVQLAIWQNSELYKPGYPNVVLGGEEMLLINKGEVVYSLHAPMQFDQYTAPQPLSGPNTALNEIQVTATADGGLIVVNREDGEPIPELLPRFSYRFHQFTRDEPTPGGAFLGDQDVTPVVEPLHLATCPVLSPDGLRLFFASTDAPTLTEDNVDQTVGIFYTERDDPFSPWHVPQRLAIANGDNGITCPSSVTADGCELAYHQFHYQGGDYRMFLAVRSP